MRTYKQVSGKLKNIAMRYILTLLFLTFVLKTSAQVIDIRPVTSPDLIKILNNIEKISDNRTSDLIIKVYKISNDPGSAGFDNGEVTEKLYFAVSDFGEYPTEKLYLIGSFYNPGSVKWNNSIPSRPEFTIEFGLAGKRQKATFIVELDKITRK